MPDIQNVIDIKAPIETVHSLISTSGGIAKWWSPNVLRESKDDEISVHFGDKGKIRLNKVEDSPTMVQWRVVLHDSTEWLGTDLLFRLTEDNGWTVLEFDHAGWREATSCFRFCSTKWPMFLLSIKWEAEAGNGAAYPNDVKIGRND